MTINYPGIKVCVVDSCVVVVIRHDDCRIGYAGTYLTRTISFKQIQYVCSCKKTKKPNQTCQSSNKS